MARLTKVHVSTGVAWVEAPEVGLKVLCGCPADAVKHLMRRGLIVETERQGVAFETGPNAILLSDVMLQNGTFCNLAEFPALQMLYRQGMLLPGHPNNSGTKPILIGFNEQVEAQLHYIYRGNYGLVSREELLAAGAPPDMVDDLLELKRKFAFGSICDPKELLDTLYLGNKPVTLNGGVSLRRLDLNQFEFRLGEDSVTVDLNLAPDQTYEPPYVLGAFRFDRGYFSVVHSGEGDGWDPSRPSMGSVLVYQGHIYLVDAGPNVQYSLNALGIGINEIEGLFHTHCHDDHFAGLTSLLRTDRRIRYYATPLVRASVTKKLSALLSMDQSSFADCFEICDLEFDRWNDIQGLEVMPILSPHPVETSVFLFRTLWEDGYRQYAHFADIVSLDLLGQMRASDGQPGISQAFYDKVVTDYATPAYVKKLDVGGGLIHGVAEDFRGDASNKIILAHTSRPLTAAEKEIGSDAPFGTVDVIVPGNHDYVWRSAYEALRTYFPRTEHHELRVLLNSPLSLSNPGTMLLREGEEVKEIYLVITGTVEVFDSTSQVNGVLSSGAMVGEMAAMESAPSEMTFRTSSFVQALRISARLYREFLRRNDLERDVMALHERRNFLRSSWLCSDGVSDVTLNRLAKDMPTMVFDAADVVDPLGLLAFVKSGVVEMRVGRQLVELLTEGDFFCEEVAIFAKPPMYTVHAASRAEIYLASPPVIRDVPIMLWKLLESHERRLQLCALDVAASGRVRTRRSGRRRLRA